MREMQRYSPGYAEIRSADRPITWEDVHRLREKVWNTKQRAASPCRKPPEGLVENPFRPGSWGRYDRDGRFREEWRLDQGRPEVQSGHGSQDHIHLNNSRYWYLIGD